MTQKVVSIDGLKPIEKSMIKFGDSGINMFPISGVVIRLVHGYDDSDRVAVCMPEEVGAMGTSIYTDVTHFEIS
jgi:hypothetical protein